MAIRNWFKIFLPLALLGKLVPVQVKNGGVNVDMQLPRQGVSLLVASYR